MIVPMMKVSLVVSDGDSRTALKKLRNEGVLHLESRPHGSGENLESLLEMRTRVISALGKLDGSVKSESDSSSHDGLHSRELVLALVEEIISIEERIRELREKIGEITRQISLLGPFGDFEPGDLDFLGANQIDMCLFRDEVALTRSLRDAGATIFQFGKRGKLLTFAAVFFDGIPELAVDKAVILPKSGLNELNLMKNEVIGHLENLKSKLLDFSKSRLVIEQVLSRIEQDIEFESLATGMPDESGLRWLSGFAPANRLQSIRTLSSAEGWGILIQEPNQDDQPPTLIENGPKIRIIQPVFDFLETLPGYREYDISAHFLVYFSIFFAMLVGDAGYGMISLFTALILIIRSLQKGRRVIDAVKLLTVLSIITVLWGTITGNWFGSKTLAGLGFFRMLTIPSIAAYPDIFPGLEVDPRQRVMWLCFLLGLSQLTLANIMNFIRDFPKLRALAQFGWTVFIGGLYFLVLWLVIGVFMPRFAVYMIAGGIFLVFLFGEQGNGVGFFRGILKGFRGAFATFLSAISGFSNILSYIRLFAVGLATFYIASTVNSLALPMLKSFTLPIGIIIIAFGHGLNLLMAALSVVVHGIRLNMLEFAGQLGMEWTGKKYSPFEVRALEENNSQGVSL